MDDLSDNIILLVDDNSENIEFLDEALGKLYRVMAATDGYTALDIIEKHTPDLVLLDIVMPGIDGYEVCKKIKEVPRLKDLPIIFLTGRKNLDDKNRGFQLGAVDYITKPFDITEVKARVKNQLMVKQAQTYLVYKNRFLESEVYNRNQELSKTQADLEESEEKFRLLFQRTSNAIVFYEPIFNEEGRLYDCRFQDVNPGFFKMMKKNSLDEVIGHTEREVFPWEDDQWFDRFRRTAEGGSSEIFEIFHPFFDRYLTGSSFKPQQERNYFCVILHDISEQILYQQELLKAKEKAEESDKLKSAFLANISHEIRTPLNGIIGFTQLMKQDVITPTERARFQNVIQKSSKNLISIIDEIIDFARIESGSFYLDYHGISLNKLIHQQAEFFRQELRNLGKTSLIIEEVVPLPDGMDNFVTDKNRLSKIFSNLLSNAVKFSDEGNIWVGYNISEIDKIEFFVRDTGIGITPQGQEVIFNSFRQEKEGYNREHGGIGLGLAITKKMVEQMGGEILVDSTKGEGSSFTFSFHSEDLNPVDVNSLKVSKNIGLSDFLHGKTILFLDNNPLSQDYMSKLLGLKNINFLQAQESKEMERLCREHPEIDLIIMSQELILSDPLKILHGIENFYQQGKKLLFLREDEKVLDEVKASFQGILNSPLDPLELYPMLNKVLRQD